MGYEHNVDACFADRIGPGGIARAGFERLRAEAGDALGRLAALQGSGRMALFDLPATRADLPVLQAEAERFRNDFDRVIVLGTGGSSLGAMALTAIGVPDGPELIFLDNFEPYGLDRALAGDLSRTGFIAISKSGGTAETVAQLLACIAAAEGRTGGRSLSRTFLCIAGPGDSPMRRIARAHAIPVLDHPPEIGGRYSVLTLVGMLPGLIGGYDVAALRAGAAEVLSQAIGDPRSPPVVGAALQVAAAQQRGIRASVLMPYESRLDQFSRWFCQLWAESLGKDGMGTLPVRALGPVDQHSQLQLYLEGPPDKLFTLILSDQRGQGPVISPQATGGDPALAYLAGHTLGDVAEAEGRATAATLIARGRPTRVIRIDRVDEFTLGSLFMHFMVETILAAHLMAVDPFDQPAVEEGKRRTRDYLLQAQAERERDAG